MKFPRLLYLILAALVIGSIINWLIKDYFPKYVTEEVLTIGRDEGLFGYLVDLNRDGLPEVVRAHFHDRMFPSLYINKLNGDHIEQFTIQEDFLHRFNLGFEDINNNDSLEIFIPHVKGDSLFFSYVEFGKFDNYRTYYLGQINRINGKVENGNSSLHFSDTNGDGIKELYVPVNSGYSLQPRKIYRIDFKTDSVYKSPFTGFFMQGLKFQENMLIPDIHSSRNFPKDTLYSDHYPWFTILNPDLSFKVKPYKLNSSICRAVHTFILNDHNGQFVISRIQRMIEDKDSLFHLISMEGDLLKSIDAPFKINQYTRSFKFNDSTLILLNSNTGETFLLDRSLQFKTYKKFPEFSAIHLRNLDDDLADEIILGSNQNKTMTIYQQNFNDPVSINFNGRVGIHPEFSTFKIEDSMLIAFQGTNELYVYAYFKNPKNWYKYIAFSSVYLAVFLLLLGVRSIYSLIISNRQRQLLELQMKAFKDQFNVHFTFNTLNAIGSVIYNREPEKAHQLFTKFASLIRTTLENSDRTSVLLKEEIEYVQNYLELQKFRFKEQFDFELSVENQVDSTKKVPKLLIQTYVENAFKHAFTKTDKINKLEIRLSQKTHQMLITITDNGSGINKEALTNGTQKGLKMMDRYFKMFYKLFQVRVEQKIETVYNDKSEICGTKVTLTVSDK